MSENEEAKKIREVMDFVTEKANKMWEEIEEVKKQCFLYEERLERLESEYQELAASKQALSLLYREKTGYTPVLVRR